jgi:1-aminocyclopropane-1-carboxylate deaminase
VKGKENDWTPMLEDIAQGGGTITWTNRTQFYHHQHWQQIAEAQGLHWIPMGADGAPGSMGVTQYCNRLPPLAFDEIWCAAGTGTTIEGVYHSLMAAANMVAFMPGFNDPALVQKMDQLAAIGKRKLVQRHLPHDKFGKWTPEQIATMNHWYQHTGIGTDIVYTGKLLQLLQTALAGPVWAQPTRVLWIHTGGLQGNRSLKPGVLHYPPQP